MRISVTAQQLSELTGATARAARNWLAGRFKPSRLARRRLEEAGVVLELPPLRRRRTRRGR